MPMNAEIMCMEVVNGIIAIKMIPLAPMIKEITIQYEYERDSLSINQCLSNEQYIMHNDAMMKPAENNHQYEFVRLYPSSEMSLS